MFNLVQVQSELQGTPLPDVMKYANGSNPQVPAYLALSELQRRKQLEDTSTAFYGQQPTIKQQIESGLTSLPQGQVNLTQAPAMTDPTAMPPQLAPTPVAPNKGMATNAPAGMVDPTVAPKMMADGGLATLPVPHMFHQNSYADGGIIHFYEGGTKEDREAQMKSDRESLGNVGTGLIKGFESLGNAAADILTMPIRGVAGALNTAVVRPLRAVTGSDIPYILGHDPALTESLTPFYDKLRKAEADKEKLIKPVQIADPNVYDREDAEAGVANKVKPNKIPANPNQQASNTGSAKLPPAPAPAISALGGEFKSNIDMGDAGKIQTPEQVYAQQQKIRELTGVSNDPLKDIKDRYAKLEEKRATQESQDPYDNLMHRLAAFSQAKATEGFGAQMGASAEAGAKLEKEQQALRDKQAVEMNALQLSIAKEDDARKRGDAKGIEEAIAAQKKAKMDLYKLQNEEKTAAATFMNAQTNVQELPIKQQNANANMIQANASRTHAGRLTELEARMKLLKDDPATYAKMYPDVKENPLVTQAAKHYFENELLLKKDYPTLDEYLVSKGLSSRGGASGSKIMTMADVKTTAEKSGRSEQEVMNAARAKGYTIQ